MYADIAQIDRTLFYQGDLVRNFPLLGFPDDIQVFKEASDGRYDRLAGGMKGLPDADGENVLAGALVKNGTIVIISQTCDVQQRERIAICPVFPISIVPPKRLESVMKRKIYYWFYLPALDGVLEESVIDLQGIISIPKSVLTSYLENKALSLSDWGRHHLGWALQNYFARPIEDKNA